MNNETDIGIKFSASVNGNKKLQELASSLSIIKAVADGLNTGAIDSIEVSSKEMKDISKNTKNTANVMKLAFNFSTVRMFARTLGNVTKELTRLANKSSEYLENVNLFQVAFDGNYRSAEKFINKVSEMYGLDESRLTRVVGIFKQLSNAMNVSAETGEKLAKLMTQMSLDISSLYNTDFERSVSVLQSAISGQTKPIRGTTGADITQSTLQTTLDSLGIDRAVNQLTFAEKRLLIIISLTQQLKEATNDLGRTIESPANQLKVLSEQWQRLSRALGNTFLPILAKILPYLNAIMMVLTEIINMIAKLFGYKEEDYDYFGGTDEAVMNLEDSLGKATAGVGKLKKALSGLRNFDRLNVISTPASGGGGGGSAGLGSGMDPNLLKAFNNAFDSYQDKLENVRMKASKIRDSIMEWLGFTKEIDPMTGKIVWKYQGIKTTLSNIWKWFKDLSPLAKTLVTYLGYIFGSKILNGAKKLLGLFTNIKPIKIMNEQFKNMVNYVKMYTSLTGNKKDGLIAGIDAWGKNASAMERVQTALGGIITTGVGLVAVKTSMDSINDSGLNLINTLGLVGGTMSSMFGGMMTGIAVTGNVWGGLAGAVIGGISAIIDAFLNYKTERDKMVEESKESLKETQKYTDEIKKDVADTMLKLTSELSETNYHEKILDELDGIIDKNGQIKSGYEDRAKYILDELSTAYGVEYKLINGNLVESEKFTDEIKKRIALKEQELILEAYKEDYISALKRQKELYHDMQQAESDRDSALAHLNERLEGLGFTYEEYTELLDKSRSGIKLSAEETKNLAGMQAVLELSQSKELETLATYDEKVRLSAKNYQDNADIMARYSDFKTAVETGNMKEIEKARDEFVKTYVKDGQTMTQSDSDLFNQKALDYQTDLQRWKKANDERYDSYKKSLTDVEDFTDYVTPDIVQKWVALGNTSANEFTEEFSKLPENIQNDIVSEMYSQGYKISDELQRGLNSINISKSIVIDAQLEGAKKKLNEFVGKVSSNFSLMGIKINPMKFASGGMPQVGQIFVANEKGPELVGNIGGQSFVANQNQMLDLLDRKIGNVQQKKEPTIINIYLDEQHKLGTYTLEQLEGMAKTIGKPIKIG